MFTKLRSIPPYTIKWNELRIKAYLSERIYSDGNGGMTIRCTNDTWCTETREKRWQATTLGFRHAWALCKSKFDGPTNAGSWNDNSEEITLEFTHTHTHTHAYVLYIYIYIYIYTYTHIYDIKSDNLPAYNACPLPRLVQSVINVNSRSSTFCLSTSWSRIQKIPGCYETKWSLVPNGPHSTPVTS